jgi:hypothetical protein
MTFGTRVATPDVKNTKLANEPSGPVGPVAPAGPVGPVTPLAPVGPITPGETLGALITCGTRWSCSSY